LKNTGHSPIQLKPAQNVIQRSYYSREDLEGIGESLTALRQQVTDYFTGFWELDYTGTYVWHQGAPGAYINTGLTRRDWFGVSHPVYLAQGFVELTALNAHVFHAGDPDLNKYADTKQTRHSYKVYRKWKNVLIEWLTNHGMNVVNGDPDHGRKADLLRNGDTYKFWWFNSVQLYGTTYGLGADLHLNGNMGSCWLKDGPDFGLNAQNNPIANQMQARLRRLAKFGWSTQKGGQKSLIPYYSPLLKPAWINATN
jgi:hypothetical protein